ncbi:MAG: GDSL-type esterase/lipase family protein [Planctomycetota bacterium]|nr:GDSL-type esterase/lipase family protein [Planctomycetota bacterium]
MPGKMLIRWFVLCVGCGFGAALLPANAGEEQAAPEGDSPALPVAVPANDPKLQYTGRWELANPAAPEAEWPASELAFTVSGGSVNLVAEDRAQGTPNPIRGIWADYFTVLVGDAEPVRLGLHRQRKVYRLAENLPQGKHVIRVYKRCESHTGRIKVLGLQLEQGARLLDPPARPRRRIEFIGDSITCAYGNEAPDKSEHSCPYTENNYLSYAAVAARALQAEHHCIAWSGMGVFQNYGGKRGVDLMPDYYLRTLPTDTSSRWEFKRWTPDAVVINLGTNDFSPKESPTREEFNTGYAGLVKTVRANYPDATIVCAVGCMMGGAKLETIRGYLAALIEEHAKAGDAKLHYVEFEPQKQEDGIGADWHPSVKTHAKMATVLTAKLKELMGW